LLLRQTKRQGRVFLNLDKDIRRSLESSSLAGIIVVRGKRFKEENTCHWLGVLLDVRPEAEDFKGLYMEVGLDEVLAEYADRSKEIWRSALALSASPDTTLAEPCDNEDDTACERIYPQRVMLKFRLRGPARTLQCVSNMMAWVGE